MVGLSIDAASRVAPHGDRHKVKSDDDLTIAAIAVNRWRNPIDCVYNINPVQNKVLTKLLGTDISAKGKVPRNGWMSLSDFT